MSADHRLHSLGLVLPSAAAPVANYVPFVRTGNQLYISGQLPMVDGALLSTGAVGAGVSPEAAQAAARACGLNLLAQVKAALGSLDAVTRVVKLTGFVASTPDFTGQPQVINGASDLMVEVFGDIGRHSRSAVGVPVLPRGATVEVDAVFEVA
jgi:enamine deaminase RidA (YjgF/YER057c/UK114 family)